MEPMAKVDLVLIKWLSVRVLWVQNHSGWPRLLDRKGLQDLLVR